MMEEFNCPITNTDLSMLYARLHKPHPLNGQNKHESMITLIITTHMVLSYYHGWEFYEQKVPKRLLLQYHTLVTLVTLVSHYFIRLVAALRRWLLVEIVIM